MRRRGGCGDRVLLCGVVLRFIGRGKSGAFSCGVLLLVAVAVAVGKLVVPPKTRRAGRIPLPSKVAGDENLAPGQLPSQLRLKKKPSVTDDRRDRGLRGGLIHGFAWEKRIW